MKAMAMPMMTMPMMALVTVAMPVMATVAAVMTTVTAASESPARDGQRGSCQCQGRDYGRNDLPGLSHC